MLLIQESIPDPSSSSFQQLSQFFTVFVPVRIHAFLSIEFKHHLVNNQKIQ